MGQIAQAARCWTTGWTARVRSRVSEGGADFSFLLRIQAGPGVDSTSYKMSTGSFPWGVKAAEPPFLFLVQWLCIGLYGPLHPHLSWASMASTYLTFKQGGSMRACHAAGPGSILGRDKFPE